MPRIPQRSAAAQTPALPQRRDPGQASVLTLQRAIGNQAVRQLLQRDRNDPATLSKVAKELSAAAFVNDVASGGVEEANIGFARQIRDHQKDGIKPGLNIVANLGARGRTGFVADDGTYLGDRLPAATTDLPRVAISIGRQAFDEGEDTVRGTLRHELEHAMHAQLLIAVQRKWRESLTKAHKALPTSEAAARTQFYAYAGTAHASPAGGKLTPAERVLIKGDTEGGVLFADTEFLAHLAGFMQIFEVTPAADPKAFAGGLMPMAIEQLRGAAQHAWSGAADAVKDEAKNRLTAYYRQLKPDKQRLLRDWLMFLHYRATTPWPKGATGADAQAARIVAGAFGPNVAFLEWMLKAIGEVQFAATTLSAPDPRAQVTVDEHARPRPKSTVKVGTGTVKVYTDIGFAFMGEQRRHGISLSYEGRDASQMRWLQFIWREVVPDGTHGVAGTSYHQGKAYPLTTDPAEPSQVGWNTDTATYRDGAKSAFYEVDNAVNRDQNHVEMFDEPSSPYDKDVAAGFAAGRPDGRVTGRAHLVEYLVKGTEVLFRAELQYAYTYAKSTDTPDGVPTFVKAGKASAIDPGARARLHEQFPEVDYLP